MGKTLVIAEKPAAGAEMARILGCTERKSGYIEGTGYIVTWAIGHLIGLKMPEDHDPKYKSWKLEDLPFDFPLKDSLRVLPNTSAQFKVIKELINRPDVDMLINAGDAGREGYLIQEWIYRMAGNKKPKKVLWAASLTDEALRKAFKELKESKDFDGLLREAECRAQLDYLLGINYSRALSLKNTLILDGRRAVLHYGRCQIALQKLIADRDKEIKEFVSHPYYEIGVTYENGFTGILVDDTKKTRQFDNQLAAAEILDTLGSVAEIFSYTSDERSQNAPKLYNLADLQKEMGKRYGYAPDETLALAQVLYEKHKVLSYPRTDSCYLSVDVFNEIEEHLNSLHFGHFNQLLSGMTEERKLNKNYVNDLKVTDHHALIPTIRPDMASAYGNMSEAEKNVFNAVSERLIAIFYPPYRYQSTEIITDISGSKFLSRGTTIIEPGYKVVLQEDREEEDAENQPLPMLKQDDILQIESKEQLAKKTKAPAAYTVSSIIVLMEKYSIGTSATRAEIIKKLLGASGKGIDSSKAFVKLEKGKYSITELGSKMLSFVPEELKKLELANYYEQILKQVNAGTITSEKFLAELAAEQKRIIDSVESKSEELAGSESQLKCPKCGKTIIENSKAYGCSGWREGCSFSVWKEISGKKITKNHVLTLLTKGKTSKISGFKKKNGETYSAYLVLQEGKIGLMYAK